MIDERGQWWIGSTPEDIKAYLAACTNSDAAYQANAYRLIRCPCGSIRFRLERADGVARRICAICHRHKFICRSAADWKEAVAKGDMERYACVECESAEANVAVAFAGYAENPELDAVK
ncbi:MAG TPA: hypothetical protein VMS17_16590 [Gemmataceae bacterium]|nr:hypothetical protein [Gemmataceae bacterium]